MPEYLTNLPLKATGNIAPSRFIAMDWSGDYLCRQATAGDTEIVGIAGDWTNIAPGLAEIATGASAAQWHAQAGQVPRILTNGDVCKLQLGTGGVKAGNWIMPDANGAGVIFTSGNWHGAKALQAGNVGESVDVFILIGYR